MRQASKRVLCGSRCPVGHACLSKKAPQPPQAAVWLSGTLPPSWGCASRWQDLSGDPLLQTLGGPAPGPWPVSIESGLEVRGHAESHHWAFCKARPGSAEAGGSAQAGWRHRPGLAAARAFGTDGQAYGGPAPWARRGARARRGLCPRARAWRAHGGRGPLTSSVTRGCSFPRTWLQGTRCRCCSWPNSSRGRLWGSASPALAWNCSPTLAIFPPATPAGPPSTLGPAPARLGAAPARPASAPRLPRRLRVAPPCRAHPGREGAPAEAGRGPPCAFRASVVGEWRASPWNRSSSGGYPGPPSSRFLDTKKPHLPGTTVATGPDT